MAAREIDCENEFARAERAFASATRGVMIVGAEYSASRTSGLESWSLASRALCRDSYIM